MFRFPLLLLLIIPGLLPAQGTRYCIGGRFAETPYFDSSDIRIQRDIPFSFPRRWPGSGTDTLRMDVYMPDTAKDLLSTRPCIVFFYGGAWLTGSRNDAGIRQKCFEWARRGFVAIAPSYRLGWNCLANDLLTVCLLCQGIYYDMNTAMYRGVQDARAALRFVHHFAANWQIDTAAVWVGGESAGSINALHAANWTPEYARKVFNGGPYRILGSIDSAGALPGKPFRVQGVINHCGAVVSDTTMPFSKLPMVQFHDAADCVVPYRNDRILACCATAFFFARGSARLHELATTAGRISELHTVPGAAAQHCSYPSLTLVRESSCFIKRNFCGTAASSSQQHPAPVPVSCSALDATRVMHHQSMNWSIQPNPARGSFLIVSGNGTKLYGAEVRSGDGKLVHNMQFNGVNEANVPAENWMPGVYFIHLKLADGSVAMLRLLLE